MTKLTVGSCFSGIGGLELGLEWTGGFETKWQIEKEDYAAETLKIYFPGIELHRDIRTIDPARLKPADIICGGYPCQPFSYAGQRKGAEDERNLWPEMFRTICFLRPRYALLENVPGHLSKGFLDVLADLASIGFDAEWTTLSSCSVGAPHPRERLFAVAYTESKRVGQRRSSDGRTPPRIPMLKGESRFVRTATWTEVLPELCRMDDGIPYRIHRGRCLGNAVDPQVAQKVGEMILRFETQRE